MARRDPPRGPRPDRDPDTPNPVEIAMAAINDGAPADGPAGRLLRRHTQLIDAQIASERMGLLLKLLTGLVGIALALAFGSLAWSASQERGLVIEPFSVPPDLAARGLTGQVVASQLLDRLSVLGQETQSVRAPSTYANNWNGDIKVQIPQTGVSVGELRRVLVEWLGRQTRIGGEVYRSTDGLVLAARTGTAGASVHEGTSDADLPAMVQAAAESVYATTQPYRYAIYVARDGGTEAEARSRELLEALAQAGDANDRMWAHSGLSVSHRIAGELDQAVRWATSALAIDPGFPVAYLNRSTAFAMMGNEEHALSDALEAIEAVERDDGRYLVGEGRTSILMEARARVASYVQDHAAVIEAVSSVPAEPAHLAVLQARLSLHDTTANADLLDGALRSLPEGEAFRSTFASDLATIAAMHAWERGDWAGTHALISGFDETLLPPGYGQARRMLIDPLAARAAARAGNLGAARLLVDRMPAGCYECTWTRGVVAAIGGEHDASERAFAEAVRQGPSLPAAHAAWGEARLMRSDTAGAIEQFRLAHRKGPAWADPLKGWGDALAQQGDFAGAARRYADAAKRAPRWGALHLAWGEALQVGGNGPGAREKFLLAAAMGLSPADGQRVRAHLSAQQPLH